MTYASVSEVKNRLLNANLGVSTSIVCTDTEIADLLTEADDMLNFELEITTNTTNASFTPILKKIAIDLVSMSILRGRHYKETTTEVNVERYYTITPDFTREHMRRLRRIRERLRGGNNVWVFNTATGLEVDKNASNWGGYY